MTNVFSFSLYKHSLKRLRVLGIIFLIIMCIPIFIGGIYLNIDLYSDTFHYASYHYRYNLLVSGTAAISFIGMAPLMTIYLFGFLHQRNSSDFYHSIPKSRLCVYITNIAAIMTWIAGALAGSSILSGFVFYLCKSRKPLQFLITSLNGWDFEILNQPIAYKETFLLLLAFFLCSLLITAIVTIGMSLSGTLFTALAISAIILFFPSILIFFVNTCISNIVYYVEPEKFFLLFDNHPDNLVMSILLDIVGGSFWYPDYDFNDCYFSTFKLCYTGLLSFLYLALGGLLFQKRKSECAGFSTIYPLVQTGIRCMCAITFSFIPLGTLLDSGFGQGEDSLIIILYIITIMIYFLFELISTKNVKNLKKAIPGFLIVIASNVLLSILIQGCCAYAASFQPEAQDIEYVRMDCSLPDLSTEADYSLEHAFMTQLISEYELTSPSILQLVSDNLKKTINQEKDNIYNEEDAYRSLYICANGRTVYRRIRIPRKNLDVIYKELTENTSLIDTFTSLPSVADGQELFFQNIDNPYFTPEDMRNIHACLKEEFESLSDDLQMQTMLGSYSPPEGAGYTDIYELYQRFRYNDRMFYYRYLIGPQLPNTQALISTLLAQHTKEYLSAFDRKNSDYDFLCVNRHLIAGGPSILDHTMYLDIEGSIEPDMLAEFRNIALDSFDASTSSLALVHIHISDSAGTLIGIINYSQELMDYISKHENNTLIPYYYEGYESSEIYN